VLWDLVIINQGGTLYTTHEVSLVCPSLPYLICLPIVSFPLMLQPAASFVAHAVVGAAGLYKQHCINCLWLMNVLKWCWLQVLRTTLICWKHSWHFCHKSVWIPTSVHVVC